MKVLTPAMGTVSNKNTITSIEGVLIETLEDNVIQISTYDMNKGVRAVCEASDVERSGKFIINAQRLYQTLRVLPDDDITIDINEKLNCEISSGKANFSIFAARGEDFDRLIANYSNDYSMTKDGYYFTYGYMLDEIEEAAFALRINEISQIIETENGYHIIKRLEKDDNFLATNYASLKAQYESCKFYGMIDERATELTVTLNETANEIDHNLLETE